MRQLLECRKNITSCRRLTDRDPIERDPSKVDASHDRTLLLLFGVVHLGDGGEAEMAAECGQRINVDVTHEVGDGQFLRTAGEDRDAGNFTAFIAHPYFDILTFIAVLDAENA